MLSSDSLSAIPAGSRIVARTFDGVDEFSGRPEYRDFVGHVLSTDAHGITLERDAAANGSRPSQIIYLHLEKIVRLKPIPERPPRSTHRHADEGNDAL
ncbi:DUF6725 family protein [Alloscardovia omnicolens]|uniref:DUF6725 family protein n=1 Tax=Alloscardovia omnicolens TaxID=419015 RepID=UPI003A70A7D6